MATNQPLRLESCANLQKQNKKKNLSEVSCIGNNYYLCLEFSSILEKIVEVKQMSVEDKVARSTWVC